MRPIPAFPVVPQVAAFPVQPPKKKEKPKVKTPIPGTEWLRVTTTEGNIFYTHTVKKHSVWTVPEEIKDAVEALEKDEQEKAEQAAKAKVEEEARRAEEERLKEVERIKAEVQDLVGKRKAEEGVPMDEVVISKKARVEEDEDEDDEEESDEEEWQREALVTLAAEAEQEKKKQEEAQKRMEEEEKAREAAEAEAKKNRPLNMPERVDLSIEEAKALFKVSYVYGCACATLITLQTLLREKDINPLYPWDTSLPLFISDPRYVLLPSVSARKDAFDEYCRDRARELRQSKVKQNKEALSPKDEFERLLKDEVKSTRTSWTDWRRQWKKDRRFYGWGKDDREREKRFREYLKELSASKELHPLLRSDI